MDYIKGTDRKQILLIPEAVDDYITEDNPIRFIEAFVDSLSLVELGFKSANLQLTGRPPYHPTDLLKLYLYGYLNKIRSSRKLEKAAGNHLELLWLLKKLIPDYKTIANFRRSNKKAIRSVCREFTLLCKRENLFGGELVAIDGSKFLAVNASTKNFSRRKIKVILDEVNEKINRYLSDMDLQDERESGTKDFSAEQLKAKMANLTKKKEECEAFLKQLEETGEKQISLTDPDSRSMPVGQGTDVCYNLQSSVDQKHHLIAEHDVVNDVTDQEQLTRMAKRTKETLGVDKLDVVADKGYYDGDEVKKCEEANITVYTEKPDTSANKRKGLFSKDAFHYNKDKDVYVCPAKQELTFRFESNKDNRHVKYYVASNCRSCPMRSRCTTSKENKRITRWIHEDVLDRMRERVRNRPDIMKIRRELVEHPFGTLKRWWDQGFFLMKGLPNVRTEASLSVLAYNMRRAINILGVQRLIQAVS